MSNQPAGWLVPKFLTMVERSRDHHSSGAQSRKLLLVCEFGTIFGNGIISRYRMSRLRSTTGEIFANNKSGQAFTITGFVINITLKAIPHIPEHH